MKEQDRIISIKIKEVIYDTALSNVEFWYDLDKNEMTNVPKVRIWSHFNHTGQSSKKWFDDCSYGQCFYVPQNEQDWKELVECIKDEEWMWTEISATKDEKVLDKITKEKALRQLMKES